jgi:histidinol-phosphate phosphatase family protein
VIFLDRDGTLICDPGFLSDAANVVIIPGAFAALRRAQAAGISIVVVTNQSGIGRGLLESEQVAAIHAEIDRLAAREGAIIDGWCLCPHRPDEGCDCRKPGTLLHRRAADELGLSLPQSWCVGDRVSDIAAAAALGGRAVLVRTGEGRRHEAEAQRRGIAVAEDLTAAIDLIIAARE